MRLKKVFVGALAAAMLVCAVAVPAFAFFKQKTAYEIVDCDWSSDVCSSDLLTIHFQTRARGVLQ